MWPDWHAWRRRLAHNGERRLLVLAGSESWGQGLARELWQQDALWLGQGPDEYQPQPAAKTSRYLGRSFPVLVFNAHSGLHPDAFGAVLGCVAAGGVVLLLCPPLADWPGYADPDLQRYVALPEQARGRHSRFIQRLVRLLQQDAHTLIWQQGACRPALPPPGHHAWHLQRDRRGCLNPQQRQALAMILQSCRRRRPLVLTADRGRGKSSLLGLAGARLLDAGRRVLLTAPSPHTAHNALAQSGGRLDFIAPDALLQQRPAADLLLVDEAAAIPVPMLQTLARRYCCVFATTEHGYEGTGLGFQLKFQPSLDRLAPGWRKYRLTTPARWSPQDPLEPLLFRLLALDADPPAPPPSGPWQLHRLSQRQLAEDEVLLHRVFGLLTLAHYQTSPSDLRYLLDAPGLELVVACRARVPVAVALVVREGRLGPELGQAIWRGQRRPRGHLLPQSLAFHGGLDGACAFGYDRIMRIVVHPHGQQQGIGSRLLCWLRQHSTADFLGTSFGASAELVRFWQRNGFAAVRLGLSADGVSGLHAAMMLQPLSPDAEAVMPVWQGQFSANLDFFLLGALHALPAPLLRSLKRCPARPRPALDAAIARDFAWAHRDLPADRPALARFIRSRPLPQGLDEHQKALVDALLNPANSAAQLVADFGLAGGKDLVQQLRQLLQCFFPPP